MLKRLLKTKMAEADYTQLNPPGPIQLLYQEDTNTTFVQLLDDPKWMYVGHIPTPATKLGWFIYHLIHGLAMRYPLLAVINFALHNLEPGEDVYIEEIEEGENE